MSTLLIIFLIFAALFILYLREKEGSNDDNNNIGHNIDIVKETTDEPIKRQSIKDDVKQLKSTLRKLYKKAEDMEMYDEDDGIDLVLADIKHYEQIINPYDVRQLVEKVTNVRSYRSLEKKYEHTEYGRTIPDGEIERRENVLSEAYTLAGEKTYKYILLVDIDLNTPLNLLKKAGKSYYPHEAMKIKETCSICTLGSVPFSEMDGIDDEISDYMYDMEDAGIKELISIKTIIEDDNIDDLKKKIKINDIISKNEDLQDLYFYDADRENYYELYFNKKGV